MFTREFLFADLLTGKNGIQFFGQPFFEVWSKTNVHRFDNTVFAYDYRLRNAVYTVSAGHSSVLVEGGIYCESLRFQELFYFGCIFAQVYGAEAHSLAGIAGSHFREDGQSAAAGWAPCSPEIKDDYFFALALGQIEGATIDGAEFDGRSGLALKFGGGVF